MIARRGFLLGLGAALATPAIVRAESLMKIVMPRPLVLTPSEAFSLPYDEAFAAEGEQIGTTLRILIPEAYWPPTISRATISRDAIRLFKRSNTFIVGLNSRHDDEVAFAADPDWDRAVIAALREPSILTGSRPGVS